MDKGGNMMEAMYICHPDFEEQVPIALFHKQKKGKSPKEEDERFL